VYGQSKVEAEDLVLERRGSLIVRIPVLIGARPPGGPPGFVERMKEGIQSGREGEIDNVLIRFPTWNRDAARAVAFLLEKKMVGIFHASGPRGATQYAWTMEMAALLGESAGHLVPSSKVVPRAAPRPLNSQLATEKIMQAGFGGFTDFPLVVDAILRRREIS